MRLAESVRQVGGLVAVEHTCFRVLGRRAPAISPPSHVRWASGASLAHDWRRRQLVELLPVSVGLATPEELTVLPACELGRSVAELDRAPELVRAVLTGCYPLLLSAYRELLAAASSPADGALWRVLGRVLYDLEVVASDGAVLVS